jgi:N-acetylglutamate synthase-like GNAT family acetyltransferase
MRPQIRKASPFDIPQILDRLRDYRSQMPYGFLANADDADHVKSLLSHLMAGQGVVIVAEQDKSIVGILIAGIMPSIWSRKHLMLTEFAYWVDPAVRNGTTGYRLLREYLDQAIALREAGRIANCFISKMVNSPDLKYQKFGFRKLEEFWVM